MGTDTDMLHGRREDERIIVTQCVYRVGIFQGIDFVVSAFIHPQSFIPE